MSLLEIGLVRGAASFSLAMLSLSFLLSMVRLVRGPSLPDRVVTLDLMAAIGVGMMATYSIVTGQKAILDVAVIVALITFLSTLAFASFLERGAGR